MKIGIVIPNNIWFCPFVNIYTRILDGLECEYDIISWNRDGQDISVGYQYNVQVKDTTRPASLMDYWRFARFVRKTIKKNGYKRLIIIGPHIPCFLSLYLLRWNGKYIIDYRDLSIDQKPLVHQLFALMLKKSYANVISSPGFKSFLPRGDYYMSHNFNADIVRDVLSKPNMKGFNYVDKVDVLTIGGIRDFESNVEVIESMANQEGFWCRFVGKGIASRQIEDYCLNRGIKNVSFKGKYNKEEEVGFIEESTFINIFYPRSNVHDSAVSNRFYNSLIFKRPMIVTKNTTQGNFAEEYDVGVAVTDCKELKVKLLEFLQKDFNSYAERCNMLLNRFLVDQDEFEKMIKGFVK